MDRVRRVRASRQRRAANCLSRESAMLVEHAIITPGQSSQQNVRKRTASLMEFGPELSRLNRQTRSLLRSRAIPLPPLANREGMLFFVGKMLTMFSMVTRSTRCFPCLCSLQLAAIIAAVVRRRQISSTFNRSRVRMLLCVCFRVFIFSEIAFDFV